MPPSTADETVRPFGMATITALHSMCSTSGLTLNVVSVAKGAAGEGAAPSGISSVTRLTFSSCLRFRKCAMCTACSTCMASIVTSSAMPCALMLVACAFTREQTLACYVMGVAGRLAGWQVGSAYMRTRTTASSMSFCASR